MRTSVKLSAPCFVRTTDIEERTKLVSWLESIGYTYCVGCFNARSAISSPLIPYIMVSTRAETDFVECLLYRPDNGIDCGCDVGLFRTLAAIGHSNTLEQQERSMRVQVKIVAFATDKNEWGNAYCSYCPATRYFFGRGDTIEEVVADVQGHLLNLLCHRFIHKNLLNCGWTITENSVKPPIFTDEEVVKLTEKSYGMTIPEPLIVELNVEVPKVYNPCMYDETGNKYRTIETASGTGCSR